MADIAISNLPNELAAPAADDLLVIDDIAPGETKKIQVNNLLGGVTQTEMGYVHGVTSDVQTQIDAKAASSHAATHVTGGGDTIANAIAAGAAGLMTGADKTKLDGVESLAEVNNISDVNAATLTDNSIGDALHRHTELVASDGSPDPALSADGEGKVGIGIVSPAQMLHVVGLGTAATGRARVGLSETEYAEIGHRGSNCSINAVGDGNLDFRHDDSTKMSLTDTGLLSLSSGTGINEFSTDGTLAGDSDDAVPTEKAVATAINTKSDNIMINQDFSIWQRNTTFTNPANTVYTADGYYIEKAGGGGTAPSVNVWKDTNNHDIAYAQSCVLEITNVGVTGATRYWKINQKVSDYKKYRGKTVTFSIRLKASAAITLPGGKITVWDGVGADAENITSVGTSWITYSITRTISSSATELRSVFNIVDGAGVISTTGSIYIQYMKLELGSVATPLIPKSKSDTLLECMPFYQKSYAQGTFAGTNTTVGNQSIHMSGLASSDHAIYKDVTLPVVMNAAPSVTLYPIDGADAGQVTMIAGDVTGTAYNVSDSGFLVGGINGAASTERKLTFHYVAVSSP